MKSMYKQIFIILLVSSTLTGQESTMNPFQEIYFNSLKIELSNTPYHFKTRVNLLDHFFKRFNMEMNYIGEKVDIEKIKEFLDKPQHKQHWIEMKQYMLTSITDSSAYFTNNKLFKDFENEWIKTNAKIDFSDGQWYGIADTHVKYNKETITLKIIWGIKAEKKGYKWLIHDVIFPQKLKMLKNDQVLIEDDYCQDAIYINPMAHVTHFSGLDSIFNSLYLRQIFSSHIGPIKKRQLLHLVGNNQLRYIRTLNIRYVFIQVPGYMFYVDYFNRKEQNSGWLISKILKYDECQNTTNLPNILYKFE